MSSGTTLLLIDVQNDFLARPELDPDRGRLVEAIGQLLRHARAQDWPVVHVRTLASPDGSDWMPHRKRSGSTDCIRGTPGAEPPASLTELAGEAVLEKRFFSAFENPELVPLLKAAGTGTIVVAGVHSHACVRSTVTDAYARGFEVLIPVEAVGSYDRDHGERALQWLDGRAARCVPLAEIAPGTAGLPDREPLRWESRNPGDWEEILGEIPLAGERDVSAAATQAAVAQADWEGVPIAERAARLRTWRERLSERREQWVELLVRTVGKPRGDAEAEIGYGLALLDHVCATLGDVEAGEGREVRFMPHGVIGLITPWNNPFAIPISKIAPALGYGNAAVWKPALPASLLSMRLHESLGSVGLGALVKLALGGAAAGKAVVEAPAVAAVAFTGSVAVGRELAGRCGRLFKSLQAELGGNNAAIVLADADIGRTAEDLAGAMFSFAGQRCTAVRRLIVEEPIAGTFAEALKAAVEAIRVGPPSDPGTRMGPLISMAVRDGLLAQVRRAREQGARLLTGGGIPAGLPEQGCWMEPTVMTDVPEDSPVLREEMFGPVVTLSAARDLDDAIVQHNRVRHGLLGAIYTDDPGARARFLAGAQAGLLSINQARPPFAAAGPFVGWKASGFGCPEHGRWNRDFYTRVQAVYG